MGKNAVIKMTNTFGEYSMIFVICLPWGIIYGFLTSRNLTKLYFFKEVDVLCLIQCTSPFIQPDFLESGYKLVMSGYDSVFSSTR